MTRGGQARREDIPLLIERFVERFNATQDKRVRGVSPDALAVLMAHDYPGNVRELQNAIEHAFVLCHEGLIQLAHLPPELVPVSFHAARQRTLQDAVAAIEAQVIQQALARSDNNQLLAARALDLHKSTLFRKARQLGLELPQQDGRAHPRRAGRRRGLSPRLYATTARTPRRPTSLRKGRAMARIAVIYCKKIKDHSCIACCKCFKGMAEKNAEFGRHDTIELVAMTDCGDCPGLTVPRVKLLTELTKSLDRSIEVLHLGTCVKLAMETAQCPIDYDELKLTLEKKFGIQVVLGTHAY